MFESNEDFNIDDDFLPQFIPSQITATSTQRSFINVSQITTVPPKKNPEAVLDDEFDQIFASVDFDEPQPWKRPCTEITNTITKKRKIEPVKKESIFGTSFKTKPKIIRERKFPGPAGLLPEYSPFQNFRKEDLFKDAEDSNEVTAVISQDPEDKFNGAWKRMLDDYGDLSFPRKYTIEWLKSNSASTAISSKKAPFLAVIIDKVYDSFHLKLIDEFDTIHGIIDKEAFDKYTIHIRVGNVIVLRNVGVISFSFGKQYLTISSNNIVCFYTEDNQVKTDRYLNRNEFRDLELKLQNTHIQTPTTRTHSNFEVRAQPPHNVESANSSKFVFKPVISQDVRLSDNLVAVQPQTIVNDFVCKNTQSSTFSATPVEQPKQKLSNKLKAFVFKPRDSPEVSNRNEDLGESDIDSIINNTLEGVDTDALFNDDF